MTPPGTHGRPRPVRDQRVRSRPAPDLHAQPALLAQGRERRARFRTSMRIVMESSSAARRTPRCCACSRARRPDDPGGRARRRHRGRCAGCATRDRSSCRGRRSGSIRTCCGSTSRPANAALKAKPYLGRAEFRQAISYAADRDAIVTTAYLGAARSGLRSDHPREQDLVLAGRAGVPARHRRAPRPCSPARPDRSQRRRHAGRREGAAGAVFDHHAAAARSASGPRRSCRSSCGKIGIAVDVAGLDPNRCSRASPPATTRHLLRLPGQLAGPGDEPRLLARRAARPRLEPGRAGAVGAGDGRR